MLLSGKCHCGNIGLELEWEGDPPRIPARACGCSFCVRHGGVRHGGVWLARRKRNWIAEVRTAEG